MKNVAEIQPWSEWLERKLNLSVVMRDLRFIKGYLLRDSYHRHKCPVNGREQIVGLHLEFITGSIIAFHVNRERILAFFTMLFHRQFKRQLCNIRDNIKPLF